MISEEAHLILPYHRRIDVARETSLQDRDDGPGDRTCL